MMAAIFLQYIAMTASRHAYRGKFNHVFRRTSERLINAALMGGVVARLSYRFGLQGRISVTRHEVALPAQRRLARPLRLAFASDFHAGPTTDPRIFDELMAQLDIERPDALLLGGDFISGDAGNALALASRLAACRPPLGKFGVMGNHDLWSDDVELRDMLEDAGVEMLINRNVALGEPFGGVSLCGMDDPWTGAPDCMATFDGAHATRVLLMHAPDGILLLNGRSSQRFDVAFAGHTHGGQVALPGGTPVLLPKGPMGRSHYHGRYHIEGNGNLIVSRGVGCSTIPLRVNADPELVICTIQ